MVAATVVKAGAATAATTVAAVKAQAALSRTKCARSDD
jgi:hypothetical protein